MSPLCCPLEVTRLTFSCVVGQERSVDGESLVMEMPHVFLPLLRGGGDLTIVPIFGCWQFELQLRRQRGQERNVIAIFDVIAAVPL